MKREIVEKIFETLYKDVKLKIKSYEVLHRNKFEDGEWVDDSPSIFIGVSVGDRDKLKEIHPNLGGFDSQLTPLTEQMCSFTGFELNIFTI